VSFVAITLCVASQRVFIVVSIYLVSDSVRKRLNTPSYAVYSEFYDDRTSKFYHIAVHNMQSVPLTAKHTVIRCTRGFHKFHKFESWRCTHYVWMDEKTQSI